MSYSINILNIKELFYCLRISLITDYKYREMHEHFLLEQIFAASSCAVQVFIANRIGMLSLWLIF